MAAYITPEEYLQREYEAEMKSEYSEGLILEREHPTPERARLNANLIGAIGAALQESSCQGLNSDMRVFVEKRNAYFYPDVSVVCGEPQCQHSQNCWSLTNPTLLIEVVFSSTAQNARSTKFTCCQALESLQIYVLVSQDRPRVECYTRQADGSWSYTRTEGLEAAVELDNIGCILRLADIYARVTFPTPQAESAEAEEPTEADINSQEMTER